jgi:hypothetical protein
VGTLLASEAGNRRREACTVIAHSDPTPYSVDAGADGGAFVHEPDTEPPAHLAEPVTRHEAARRQFWALTPPPASLGTIVGGGVAVLGGGAIGYWLGRRSTTQRRTQVRRAASSVNAVVELAPVAFHLLANPIVRALVLRMLVRKISPRAPS